VDVLERWRPEIFDSVVHGGRRTNMLTQDGARRHGGWRTDTLLKALSLQSAFFAWAAPGKP
jgi:hypothetical protein